MVRDAAQKAAILPIMAGMQQGRMCGKGQKEQPALRAQAQLRQEQPSLSKEKGRC